MNWLVTLWRRAAARFLGRPKAKPRQPKERQARETNADVLRVRARLLDRGETLASWARASGHDPETARRVVYRWAGRRGVPTGPLTRSILRDLSQDLGIQIPPGIDWAAADAVAQTNPLPAGGRPSKRTA